MCEEEDIRTAYDDVEEKINPGLTIRSEMNIMSEETRAFPIRGRTPFCIFDSVCIR